MGLKVAASTEGGGPWRGGTVSLALLLQLLLWIPIATFCNPAQTVTAVSYREAGSVARNIQHRSGCMEAAVNGYAPLQDFVRFGLSVAGFHPTSQEAAAFMPPLRQLFLSLATDGPSDAKDGEEDDSAASLFTFIRTQNESSGGSFVFSGTQIPACHSLCSQEAAPTTSADFCDLLSKWHHLQRFLKQLHKALDIPRKQSVQTEENNNNKPREGVAVVVVGGGPVGLLSAIEAYKGGAARVHLVEKRGDYSRDTWFDLYDRPFSPAFAWLQELAYHLLQPDMQYVLNDRDADYRDDEGRQQPQSNEGKNERPPKQVAVVTVRAQVLERFLAKVASILGINLHYDREFVAYCPPQQWQKTSELTTGGGRYRALLHHTKEALSPEIFSMELSYSASFWCHDGTSPTTTALQHELQNAHLLTCNKNGGNDDGDENIQKQSALFEWLPFDVLVAADGASSQVRRFAGIPFTTQETFQVTPYHKITVPDLHQTTLLVNFKSAYKSNIGYDDGDRNMKASGCLVVKDLPVDHAGLIIDGVSGVYKRFYYGHCHMQVLFTDDYSNRLRLVRSNNGSYQASALKEDHSFRLWRSGSSSALPTTAINATKEAQQHIPWDKLLEVSNELLEMPCASLSELQETISLRQKVGRTSSTVTQREKEGEQEREEEANLEYDMDLFDIRIKKAAQYTKLEVFSSSFNKHEASGKDSAAVIFLSGDASVTAHYRLGIGINNAFEALSELSSLIRHLSLPHHLPQNAKERAKSWAYAVAERERRASQRIDRMVQLQLSTMFFESYCDFGVWFDAEAPSIYASQVVLAKHRPSRDYLPPHGLNAAEVLQLCQALRTVHVVH